MTVNVKDLLSKQRRRSTGSILGYIEGQPWYALLSPPQKRDLREKVLSAEAAYHDVVLDVVSTLDGAGGSYNDRALELLESIHGLVQQQPLAAASGG